MTIESRRFTVELDWTGPTGDRMAEILLRDGAKILANHVVTWEVVSPVMVSPKVLVIRAAKRDYQILIQSRD